MVVHPPGRFALMVFAICWRSPRTSPPRPALPRPSLSEGIFTMSPNHGLAVLTFLLAAAGPAVASEPDAAGVEFFEKTIRPILVERCYSCHSGQAKRLRGGLHLDSEQGWLRGGDLGPSVAPGRPEESLLIQAVRHEDELLKMPPKGKLDDGEIASLTRWVAMGAPAPRDDPARPAARGSVHDVERGRDFWAFRAP